MFKKKPYSLVVLFSMLQCGSYSIFPPLLASNPQQLEKLAFFYKTQLAPYSDLEVTMEKLQQPGTEILPLNSYCESFLETVNVSIEFCLLPISPAALLLRAPSLQCPGIYLSGMGAFLWNIFPYERLSQQFAVLLRHQPAPGCLPGPGRYMLMAAAGQPPLWQPWAIHVCAQHERDLSHGFLQAKFQNSPVTGLFLGSHLQLTDPAEKIAKPAMI